MTLPFTAGDLCTRDVAFTDRGMMAGEAARLMRTHHVGSLVVVDERSPATRIVVGIVTDRDIATAIVGADRDPRAFRVGDIMADGVVTAREADSITDVLAVMRRKRIRRMPVTGAQGELVGILSIDDILGAVAEQMRALADAVSAAGKHES
jgi:CBS domain-containing protein